MGSRGGRGMLAVEPLDGFDRFVLLVSRRIFEQYFRVLDSKYEDAVRCQHRAMGRGEGKGG